MGRDAALPGDSHGSGHLMPPRQAPPGFSVTNITWPFRLFLQWPHCWWELPLAAPAPILGSCSCWGASWGLHTHSAPAASMAPGPQEASGARRTQVSRLISIAVQLGSQ